MTNQQTKSPAKEKAPVTPVVETVENEDDSFGDNPKTVEKVKPVQKPVEAEKAVVVETAPVEETSANEPEVVEPVDTEQDDADAQYEQPLTLVHDEEVEQEEAQAETVDVSVEQEAIDIGIKPPETVDDLDGQFFKDQFGLVEGTLEQTSASGEASTNLDFSDTASVVGLVLNLAATGIVIGGVNGGTTLNEVYLNQFAPATIPTLQLVGQLPKKLPKSLGSNEAFAIALEGLLDQARENNNWVVRAYVSPESKKLKTILQGGVYKSVESGDLVDLVEHIKAHGLDSVSGHSIVFLVTNTSKELLNFFPAFDGETPQFTFVEGSLELITPSLVGLVRLVKFLSGKGISVAVDPESVYHNWITEAVTLQTFEDGGDDSENPASEYGQLTQVITVYPRLEQYGLLLKIPANAKLSDVLDPFVWQEQLLEAVNTATVSKDEELKLSRYLVVNVGENDNSGFHTETLLGADKLVRAAVILRQSAEIVISEDVEDEEIEDEDE